MKCNVSSSVLYQTIKIIILIESFDFLFFFWSLREYLTALELFAIYPALIILRTDFTTTWIIHDPKRFLNQWLTSLDVQKISNLNQLTLYLIDVMKKPHFQFMYLLGFGFLTDFGEGTRAVQKHQGVTFDLLQEPDQTLPT